MKTSLTGSEKDALLPGPRLPVGPNEKLETAQSRLKQLEHEVAEAQKAVDKSPDSEAARGKLDMMTSIRDAGRKDVANAEEKLRRANDGARELE